jgi:hypothetical protein
MVAGNLDRHRDVVCSIIDVAAHIDSAVDERQCDEGYDDDKQRCRKQCLPPSPVILWLK